MSRGGPQLRGADHRLQHVVRGGLRRRPERDRRWYSPTSRTRQRPARCLNLPKDRRVLPRAETERYERAGAHDPSPSSINSTLSTGASSRPPSRGLPLCAAALCTRWRRTWVVASLTRLWTACERLQAARVMVRRIGAVPNHYAVGYRANGMSVWDVDPTSWIGELFGRRVGALDFVTHCLPPAAAPAAIGPITSSPWSTAADREPRWRAKVRLKLPTLLGSASARSRRALQHARFSRRPGCASRGCKGRLTAMFRLNRNSCSELVDADAGQAGSKPPGPVVIWNLIRRCNLNCKSIATRLSAQTWISPASSRPRRSLRP